MYMCIYVYTYIYIYCILNAAVGAKAPTFARNILKHNRHHPVTVVCVCSVVFDSQCARRPAPCVRRLCQRWRRISARCCGTPTTLNTSS